MGRLIIFNMMSVDGLFEGPNNELDWHKVDQDFNDFAIQQLSTANVLIFGRKTYELMSGYWPSAEGLADDPVIAGKMNSISKIVFSKTLDKADWFNTRLFKDNVEQVIKDLKKNTDQNLFIFGSANLAAFLGPTGLIDEYRIIISPIILGKGNPLFSGNSVPLKLKLLNSRTFANGNVLLQYVPE